MLYSLLRSVLFSLDPETAHSLGMNGMAFAKAVGCSGMLAKAPAPSPTRVMGLTFRNRVGLAAGLDKNGEYVDALGAFGFGSVEIGTVTPRPQPGNPKPRMFRIKSAQAIINRMGFNNEGVDQLLENIRGNAFQKGGGILGINIGKNADTPIERAADDYLLCLDKVYAAADYVAVNISSPNTKNLRDLQRDDALDALLGALRGRQVRLADKHGKYVPLVLKIAPDLDDGQIVAIAEAVRQHRFDGVIATNTTLSRREVEGLPHAAEAGGLSGAPVFARATAVQEKLVAALQGEIPVIGVGGIMKGDDALAKVKAGAKLVQIYTGFIYRGPELIGEIAEALKTNPD